jgi:hypothetical protein
LYNHHDGLVKRFAGGHSDLRADGAAGG